jgi:hypothetical protein
MFLLGLTVVLLAATYIFMPSPSTSNTTANSLDDFTFPTNSNTTPVAEVFGTVKIGGNILWYGDLSTSPIKKSS